jgi:putative flippase GtrA
MICKFAPTYRERKSALQNGKLSPQKIKETIVFLVTYSLVGLIGFGANLGAFSVMLRNDIPVGVATGTAFLIGGQVSFVAHDRITFGRVDLHLEHWWQRWWRMMGGQAAGFTVNGAVANGLLLADRISSFSVATQYVYIAATASGAIVTCCAAKFYSHKEGSDESPAEAPDEHTQE